MEFFTPMALVTLKKGVLDMTPRDLLSRAGLTPTSIVLGAFAFGGAWAGMRTAIDNRPTKEEVRSIVAAVADTMHHEDAKQAAMIGGLKLAVDSTRGDVRTIIYILCGKASPDSFCHKGP